MNAHALMALLADLYAQLTAANNEVAQLRELLRNATPPVAIPDAPGIDSPVGVGRPDNYR